MMNDLPGDDDAGLITVRVRHGDIVLCTGESAVAKADTRYAYPPDRGIGSDVSSPPARSRKTMLLNMPILRTSKEGTAGSSASLCQIHQRC